MTNKHHDKLQRFIFESCDIRGEIVCLNKSFQEACAHQNLSSLERRLLGQFLTAAGLLADSLKFDGLFTIQARGDGAIPLIMAEANHKNSLRGIVKKNSPVVGPELPLPELLGKAALSITVDPDKGERYQGIVPLDSPTLADCLNDYFTQSEQLPSRFFLYADDHFCGGIFLQALPAEKIKDAEQTRDKWDTAIQLAATLSLEELRDLTHEEVLYRLFHEMECKIFPEKPLQFACSCTEERSSNAIMALGHDDAKELLKQQGKINIHCEFCGKNYAFDAPAVDAMFTQRH